MNKFRNYHYEHGKEKMNLVIERLYQDNLQESPQPMSGHKSCRIGENIYYHHALGLFRFNLKAKTWKKIKTENDPPTRRNHVFLHYHKSESNSDFFVIFGGINQRDLAQSTLRNGDRLMNDFAMLNISKAKLKWTNPKQYGEKPSPRCSHTGIVHKDALYIHGGILENFRRSSLIHKLSLKTFTWKVIEVEKDLNLMLSGHLFESYLHDKLITFYGTNNITMNDDIVFFDFEKKEWSLLDIPGPQPDPRTYYSMCKISPFQFLIYGGENYKLNIESRLGDMFILDLLKKEFIPVSYNRKLFTIRTNCRFEYDGKKYFYMFGGAPNGEKRTNDFFRAYFTNNCMSTIFFEYKKDVLCDVLIMVNEK